MAQRYGAFGEKTLYGKKSLGIIRSTFIIDKHGVVRHALYGVKAAGHAQQVLALVKKLRKGA